MRLVDAAIRYPVSVTVGVLFALTFGTLALYALPVQLIPTLDRPEITVQTRYPGAGPFEVEEQITDRQEELLNALENLREMNSVSEEGESTIVLKYGWGTNKDVARLDVSEKLNVVQNLPDDAEEPIIRAVNSNEQSPVGWIVMLAHGQDINSVRAVAEDTIKPQLERVPGVGQVWFFGGEEREVHVEVDLAALAQRGIALSAVRNALMQDNRNVKAGSFDEGKSRYGVRTEGRYRTLEEVEGTIVGRDAFGPISIGDVARVRFANEHPLFVIRQNGQPAMIFGALRKSGSNTLRVMEGVREVLDSMNERYRERGIELRLVYDASSYIDEAITLVQGNVAIGALLAILVLLVFLRSGSAILVLGISIPISIVASFVLLYAFGRTLNIISLAGLTFVTGMVLDSAIVVVENIFRHREMGKAPMRAAADGASEVWGAILASTLTTLVVFLPILLLPDEVGQISRDMAIVISVAVSLSLIVAITVIPMLSARLLRRPPRTLASDDKIAGGFAQRLTGLLAFILARPLRLAAVVLGVPAGAVAVGVLLAPPRDHLPEGNRNLTFVVLDTPPGYNLDKVESIVRTLEERFLAHPKVKRMFTVVRHESPMMGIILKDEYRDRETIQGFIDEVERDTKSVPGVRKAFVRQLPLIRSGGIGSGQLELLVQGPELDRIQQIAEALEERLADMEGSRFVRSSFEMGKPDLVVDVDRVRASELGLTVAEIGAVVETTVNGTISGIFDDAGREIDLRLRAPDSAVESADDLGYVSIHTPAGQTVQLADIARIERRTSPVKIDHHDMDRAVKLSVGVDSDLALGEAVARVEERIARLRAELPLGYSIDFTGSAADLSGTEWLFRGVIALAVFVTYLLLASLFESFLLPLVIIVTVPFAASGGIAGLRLLNVFDSSAKLDSITMLGFIILTGVVVNNAILIVHQTLNRRSEGASIEDALLDGVRSRVRPILMTTATTTFGLLPLVVTAGSGSELYRGLGAVLVGGLATSMVFTLMLVPSMLAVVLRAQERFPLGARGAPAPG